MSAGISVVIIRNSDDILEKLLGSFLDVNTYQPTEIVIVDNKSGGGIRDILDKYCEKTLIRYIKKSGNASFAELYNSAAERATFQYLLFISDSVIYTSDVIPAAIATLENDASIGAVGVRLDDRTSLSDGEQSAEQHLGITFCWNEQRHYHQPEIVRHKLRVSENKTFLHSKRLPEAKAESGKEISAVQEAFLLVRKADFDLLHGFEETYRNDLEGVDFCLRLARDLKKKCWCIDTASLQYIGDAARIYEGADEKSSIENDHKIFKKQWGDYIRKEILKIPTYTTKDLNNVKVVIDRIVYDKVFGWAIDFANLTVPLSLVLFIDSKEICAFVADVFRNDLKEKNLGSGCNGFSVPVPDAFLDGNSHSIEIKLADNITIHKGVPKKELLFPKKTTFSSLPWKYTGTAPTQEKKNFTILFVVHMANRTGAPICILRLLEQLVHNPDLDCRVLIHDSGNLAASYENLVPTLCIDDFAKGNRAKAIQYFAKLYRDEFRNCVAVCNTAATSQYAEVFKENDIPVLSWVHELPTTIEGIGAGVMDTIKESSDLIICPSNFVRTSLLSKYEIEPNQILTIHNGTELPPINLDYAVASEEVRNEFGLPLESKIVLGCGTVDMRKGVDLFLQVAKRIINNDETKKSNVVFLWIGDIYDKKFERWLTHDAMIYGVTDNFILANLRENTSQYFAAADVFALTSREDPFPMVNMEALSFGLPVVAFDKSGGAAEMLGDGRGTVVPYADTDSMALSICKVLEELPKIKEAGKNTAKMISDHCTWLQYSQKFIGVLNKYFKYENLGCEVDDNFQNNEFTPSGNFLSATLFDGKYYCRNNNDVKEAGIDPEKHYWSNGEREGRRPNAYFDPAFYLRVNPDVRNAKASPFKHFIEIGCRESRVSQSAYCNASRISSKAAKSLLFVSPGGDEVENNSFFINALRWFNNHTTRNLKLLLLSPSKYAVEFSQLADMFVLQGSGTDYRKISKDDLNLLRKFLDEQFEFVYLDTLNSSMVVPLLNELEIAGDFLLHLHDVTDLKDATYDKYQDFFKKIAHFILDSNSATKLLVDKFKVVHNKIVSIDNGTAGAKEQISLDNVIHKILKFIKYKPSVSVIVPFYNHEKFVQERLESIFKQSIKDIEILLLDDASTDNTIKQIQLFLSDERVRLFANKLNSGSPFKQWENGIYNSHSDIIWIAEGDDSCDPNFLETLLPYFEDQMVNIAAAKTVLIDENGKIKPQQAFADYLERAYPGKFQDSYIHDGFIEVNQQLGAINNLVNASALLIRKNALGSSLQEAIKFKITGDRRIYLECLKHGKIAYDISTQNYFRRHSGSQVHKLDGSVVYFQERELIANYLVENFSVTTRIIKKVFSAIEYDWRRFKSKHPGKSLSDFFDKKLIYNKANFIKQRPHVAFYVHGMTFSKGGIERMVSYLANFLSEQGFRVTIFCRVHKQTQPIYPLYNSVTLTPIFDEHNLEKSIKALNAAICHQQVDIFIPMLSEWLFDPIVDAAQNTGAMIIVSERNDPWQIEKNWWSHEKRVACFEKADFIHFQLNKYKESLPEPLREKVFVIPNGVVIKDDMCAGPREKIILCVGRLVPQKSFDRFIQACSIIQKNLRKLGYRAEIYGDGKLKDELAKQIKSLGLDDLISLKGTTSDIDAVYAKTDFFVLPSLFESFGNVVTEALSFSLPVIAFKDCNGPNEIVQNGVSGCLVDDVDALASTILLFCEKKIHEQYRANARKRAQEYSLDNYKKLWINQLRSVYDNFCGSLPGNS